MQSVCCGCRKQVPINNRKNIYNDEIVVNCEEDDENNEATSSKKLKLCNGIEILTGHKICSIDIEPVIMCNECCEKMESYVNFRAQLLSFLGQKLKSSASTKEDEDSENIEIKPCKSLSTEETIIPVPKNDTNLTESKLSEIKIVLEDVINIDDNSSNPPDSSNMLNEDCNSNDSLNSSKQNDQENDSLNESESSNDNSDIATLKEFPIKCQENDIESDIDVCSGEDDEILELDIQCRKNETVEIGSSSESDIEVCDYEPTGKKIKHYTGLSPPIFF